MGNTQTTISIMCIRTGACFYADIDSASATSLIMHVLVVGTSIPMHASATFSVPSEHKLKTTSSTLQAKKSELKEKACQLMGLKVEDVRMWDFFGGTDLYANMEEQLDDQLTAQSNALIDKQHILLEEKVNHVQRLQDLQNDPCIYQMGSIALSALFHAASTSLPNDAFRCRK